jgi:hypothetical protein
MEITTRAIATRLFAWIAILRAILALYPVEYRFTRLTLLLVLNATWTGGLFLGWNRRLIRISLLIIGLLLTAITCLPGRPVAVE